MTYPEFSDHHRTIWHHVGLHLSTLHGLRVEGTEDYRELHEAHRLQHGAPVAVPFWMADRVLDNRGTNVAKEVRDGL